MIFYIVEQRLNYSTICANVFLGSSPEKCIEFISKNHDFADRKVNWYWAVIKITADEMDNQGLSDADIYAFYTWDGKEIDEQPGFDVCGMLEDRFEAEFNDSDDPLCGSAFRVIKFLKKELPYYL